MKKPGLIIVFSLLLIASLHNKAFSQKHGVPNMPEYDNDLFHFGFVLGVNQTFFTIRPIDNLTSVMWDSTYIPDILPLPDSARIMNLQSSATPGFVISIVSNMRLGEYFDLRFVPSLAFGDRDIVYNLQTFKNGDTSFINITKRVPSTYINFPLEVRYKAERFGNFRPYLLGGIQFTLDLASQAKKRERKSSGQKIVKLNQNDIYAEAGVGFDFYNEWFKFGIELKMMYGFMDVIKQESNIYTSGIAKMNSKIFQISFTFE